MFLNLIFIKLMVELKSEDLKKMKEEKRGFTQTYDLMINVASLDLKKPENRIRDKIKLPHKVKNRKICIIVDTLISKAKATGQKVLTKNDLDFGPKEGKKLAREYDFFIVEATIMPAVAKVLGKYIGPRNKSLIPVPPAIKDLSEITEDMEKTVSINLLKNPLIQIPIGSESLSEKEVIENFNVAYEKIKDSVEKKGGMIKSAYFKLTMSKPMKVV